MAQLSEACTGGSNAHWDDGRDLVLEPKHKIFLSHSGAQKAFVEQLCLELERCYRFPFFDKRHDSLPIGENFPGCIFEGIRQCQVGVVILSNEFFTSKWPMMELVAMVEEAENRNGNFKIMPIFLCTSLEEFDDRLNHTQWVSRWQELAMQDPKRVEIEKWKAALKYLRPINGLLYNGLGILKFQKVIVDAICEVVPPEIKLEDSHIQGRLRLCKLIQDKIVVLRKEKVHGVCVVGLYGTGGIGKTSICKVLCNEFFTEFRGRVCHAELERRSEEELLREVLKKLTCISSTVLDGFNIHELRNGLKEGIIKEPVLLTVDNMSDRFASINDAKSYLSAKLPPGSIVMVTARSKDLLLRIRGYIDENNCMEMPELEKEEAKSLFVKSSDFESSNEGDEQLIERCVKRCRFLKDSGSRSYHYHPLALHVLGSQLGFIDPMKWEAELEKVDKDIFNALREKDHPVFSILRTSFDTLSREDQLLFMDVALHVPTKDEVMDDVSILHAQDEGDWNTFKWLGMVHNIPSVDDVMDRLGRLKAKSLLESLGDGVETSIGIHDLWRAFCVAETKSGELRCRRWMCEAKNCTSELVETCPPGTCWENVVRLAFLNCEMTSKLERVNFTHFSNVTVLKFEGLRVRETVVLDLSGLVHLKSLEVSGRDLHLLFMQGLPRDLIFLRLTMGIFWSDEIVAGSSQQFVNQIGFLKELQCLQLINYSGGNLPDMRSMVSLRLAVFSYCEHVVTLTGLSSKLTNLRVLILQRCERLKSCPGVGDLVLLEVLDCRRCFELEGLPNLRKLRNLRKLNISFCKLIAELQGLDDLVALEEFDAGFCDLRKLPDMSKLRNLRKLDISFCKFIAELQGLDDLVALEEFDAWFCDLRKLPDMSKLRNLQVLNLRGFSRLTAIPGIERLISLKKLKVIFENLVERPDLRWLTKLQELDIGGCRLVELRALDNLTMLMTLSINGCSGVDEVPDLQNLRRLQTLHILLSGFMDVSGLMNLSALEYLKISDCNLLERLPDMQTLSSLKALVIGDCAMLRGWDWTLKQAEVSPCRLGRFDLLDSKKFMGSGDQLVSSHRLLDLTRRGSLTQLQRLVCYGNLPLLELPDLCRFPRLETLHLSNCESLRQLSSCEPKYALSELKLQYCSILATLPDLSNFPSLLTLEVSNCDWITTLSSSEPLAALALLEISSCEGFRTLPDLGTFPALEWLKLSRCSRLTTLSSSGRLTALAELEISSCEGLRTLPDLGTFPALEWLKLSRCSRLTTLSSSVPLPALELLEASECRSLSQDNLDQLRASLCPKCEVYYSGGDSDDGEGNSDDGERSSDGERNGDDGEGGFDGGEIDDDEDLRKTKRSRISSAKPFNDSD